MQCQSGAPAVGELQRKRGHRRWMPQGGGRSQHDQKRQDPEVCRGNAGDKVSFYKISKQEYLNWNE